MLKRTPLFCAHQKLGARLIDFGGWEMPVQYTSITDEHLAVRQAAGLFDISHMGEVTVSGPGAEAFLNSVLTNDIRKLTPGQGQYTLMCNENGGVVDDLYAYRLAPDAFFLIINASRIVADIDWLQRHASNWNGNTVNLTDASHHYAALAVQGPAVRSFINEVVSGPANAILPLKKTSDLVKNQVARFGFGNHDVLVACTGYTGEDGFEIIAPEAMAEALWNRLIVAGASWGLKPCGLGARDTLRTEVCYPLYGHELDENTTPLEAGLGAFVALDKNQFNGKQILMEQKSGGTKKKLVAFKMTDKSAPPRPHYPVFTNGIVSGMVTSGTQSPLLNQGIGMAYIPPEFAKKDALIEIEIRGRRFPAVVVPRPIVKTGAHKP